MPPREERKPKNGMKRHKKSLDFSSDATSNSDFIFDLHKHEDLDTEDDEDDDYQPPLPIPIPAPPPPLKWEIWEKDNEKWIDNHESGNLEDCPLTETADPPPSILLPLLRFQKEWLAWALKQEASDIRGGILADEMGMGKTIQAISLILTALARPENPLIPSSSLLRTRCTLVICPVTAMIQWAGEIERYAAKVSTRVLMYYGAKRGKIDHDFNDYDVVLTTYSTIENEYRKNLELPKKKCESCGKMVDFIRIHRRLYCRSGARMTKKESKQVKRKVVEDGEGIENVRCGRRERSKQKQPEPDDENGGQDEPTSNPGGQSTAKSVMHSVHWERIILDEAHFIKDRRSNTARAVFTLQSSYKWALSGTPLLNRVGELYSLVRFLQVRPFSFYLCKDCDCNVLDYSSTKSCSNFPHSTVRHFCWWNRYITNPMQSVRGSEESRRAMILLKNRLLRSLMLRRTKKGRAADLALPPRIVTLRRDTLDKNKQEFYEALYTRSRVQFDTYVLSNTLMKNFAHIFDLLTRLRQAVDHPYLVVYSKMKDECGICHDPAEDKVVTSCSHVFCKACMLDYSASLGNLTRPSCSKPLTVDLTTKNNGEKNCKTAIKGYRNSGILNRLHIADFKTSTKIDALREEIRDMVEADGSAKGLVFSQFTSFLDLINFSLQRSGVKCVQLVGSMSFSERESNKDVHRRS